MAFGNKLLGQTLDTIVPTDYGLVLLTLSAAVLLWVPVLPLPLPAILGVASLPHGQDQACWPGCIRWCKLMAAFRTSP